MEQNYRIFDDPPPFCHHRAGQLYGVSQEESDFFPESQPRRNDGEQDCHLLGEAVEKGDLPSPR